jgi:antitoxin VapB
MPCVRSATAPTWRLTSARWSAGSATTLARVRTFRSGDSEAVRLPKDIAFGENVELVAVRSGDVLTLYPASMSVAEMVKRLAALPGPPSIEKRDDAELTERVGL